MKILGIESSCDETAASVIEIKNSTIKVLSNIVSSQIKIHQQYGGVVPEVAARNHIKNIIPVVDEALLQPAIAGWSNRLDAIAFTQGPGLMSSLLVGAETAKSLAYAWGKPIIGVNHLAGHIYSNWINNKNKIKFPALALIVSGGHTELVLMKDHFKFKILGQTRDDAVGEAFDKVAKILGLGYPGGPAVSKMAIRKDVALPRLNKTITDKDKKMTRTSPITMPRPMINDDNLEFSFSGLKTSVLYQVQKDKNYKKHIPEYCTSFQQAVIDVLVVKTLKAAKKFKVKSILLAGGVAANLELREQLGVAIKTELPKVSYHIPDLKYTTDNAAMIATAGYYSYKYKKPSKVKVDCNLNL